MLRHVVITGGAGYIGSLLAGLLLQRGYHVTVVDELLFGGESILGYLHHPDFHFVNGDVRDPEVLEGVFRSTSGRDAARPITGVVHLAAIVGFPACQAIGRDVAWSYNVESTQRVFDAADAAGVERCLLASTYSNYGLSKDGQPVKEDSPLFPQSLYAETKVAAEQYLLDRAKAGNCAPIIYRFATLFGISPRTRFDLIVNQFVLEALTRRRLIIYQRGYARAFVHVRDVCEAIILALESPIERVRGEIFNVGSDDGNYTKDQIVELVREVLPGTEIEYKQLTFGGDMRDIRVSFEKIRTNLGFKAQISVAQGIRELRDALNSGLIKDPNDARYRNAQFIVQ